MSGMADYIVQRNGGEGLELEDNIECKNCGMEGLHWVSFKGKWFLFTADSTRHVCVNPYKKTAQEAFKEAK